MDSKTDVPPEPSDSQMLPSLTSKACSFRRLLPWHWRPTSSFALAYAEEIVFQRVQDCQLDSNFVQLPQGSEIRSVRATVGEEPAYLARTPIVLLHGMGAGVGLWCKNLGPLARQRPVYAIDLLGFGRSSRVAFPADPAACEEAFVRSIEDWRRAEGLGPVILLGHSFGGYLAFNYALRHPDAVSKLILADPWGLCERPESLQTPRRWSIIGNLLHRFDPLAVVRAAGPWGPTLIKRFRGDIQSHFDDNQIDAAADAAAESVDRAHDILDYIYHCNAQPPSGETGFRRLAAPLGFAQRPMFPRLASLASHLPVSLIYGGRSWLYRYGRSENAPDLADEFRERLDPGRRRSGPVSVRCMKRCNHHLYAEDSDLFNRLVAQETADV